MNKDVKLRCEFSVILLTKFTIYLADDSETRCSMTNDAEAVCRWAHKEHPGLRVMYRDTQGIWDQMVHVDGRFIRFAVGISPEAEGAY